MRCRREKEAKTKLEKDTFDREAAELAAQFASSLQTSLTEDSLTATEAEVTETAGDTADDAELEGEHDVDGDGDGAEDADEHDDEHDDEEEGDDDGEGDGEGELDVEENVPTEPEPTAPPPVPEQREEDLSEEEIEAARNKFFLEQEQEQENMRSVGQQRMKNFLDKIKQSTERHATHPRRHSKKFFMPMMFSDDIYFDPFETDGHEEKNEERAAAEVEDVADVMEPGCAPTQGKDPFDDINSRMAHFRKEEERKRKALFSTTLQEIPSKDWIRVFRTYTVDWDAFFASQDAMVELTAAVKESEREYEEHFRNNDPLKRITDTLSVGPNSPVLSRMGSHASMSSASFTAGTDSCDEALTVTLLPYGKILEHQKVKQGDYKYYKIEQHKQTALLTVEIQCSSGLVDLYLAFQKLPSMSMHDRHMACTKQNKGLVRLAFRPHKSGTFFIAVRSHSTDAKFNIWTYSSSGSSGQSPIIARVNNIIRKFEILASVDENALLEFYPKYEREALQQIEEEEAVKRQQAEASLLTAQPIEKSSEGDEDASLDELFDIESVGRFIAKVSRYTLMCGEESSVVFGEQPLRTGYNDDDCDDYEVDQEFGQEIDDLFTPLQGQSAADLGDLLKGSVNAGGGVQGIEQGGSFLPPINRAYSLPSLGKVRSEITMDSFGAEEAETVEDGECGFEQNSFKLPGIKGASTSAATPSSSYSTKRTISKSKSAISVAREYAALDRALHGALRGKGEKRERVENPLLHQFPKPVKYQLTGKNYA